MFPNIELIPFGPQHREKAFEFAHPQPIKISSFLFKIPPIAFEIAYKEEVLVGKKDIEDARHLRLVFNDIISEKKIGEYKRLIREAR